MTSPTWLDADLLVIIFTTLSHGRSVGVKIEEILVVAVSAIF